MQTRRLALWADLASLILSGIAAAIAPLRVFLFAFAVLGPLHYLTEIAWLRRKQFYFREGLVSQRTYVVFSVLAVVLCLSSRFVRHDLWFWGIALMLLLSLSVWITNRYVILAITAAAVGLSFLLKTWVFFIAAMVPTLVHVFFFTWTFMVSGSLRALRARRTSSWPGVARIWMNPALMLVIPIVLVLLPMHYHAPGGLWIKGEASSFAALHFKLAGDLHHTMVFNRQILNDPVVAGLLRIFAFAYLFHYLNWFTKTELLEWHRISRRGWAIVAALYTASLAAYGVDLRLGLSVGAFLSLLHVLLEFPLNWHTLRGLLSQARESAARSSSPFRWLPAKPVSRYSANSTALKMRSSGFTSAIITPKPRNMKANIR